MSELLTYVEAYRTAYNSVTKSFEDIGEFNTGATLEDITEMQLHVLTNLAVAFKQAFKP